MQYKKEEAFQIKEKVYEYLPLFLLILPILFLPIDWYKEVLINSETFTAENMTGFATILYEHGRIAIIYSLCILIQIFSIHKKQYFYVIFSEFVLLILFTVFPLKMFPVKFAGMYFFSRIYIGYILAAISIICSIIANAVYSKKRINI